MPDADEKHFLVHFQIGGQKPTAERLQEVVPYITGALDKISRGNKELAYRSNDGSTFGFMIRSGLSAPSIIRTLESPAKVGYHLTENLDESALNNQDRYFVLEIGEARVERGYSRPFTWLTHH
jgi:hypothetical protein